MCHELRKRRGTSSILVKDHRAGPGASRAKHRRAMTDIRSGVETSDNEIGVVLASDEDRRPAASPFIGEFARVVALTILPLLLFAIAVVAVLGARERAAVLDALEQRAQRGAADLDRVLERQITLLTALAGSRALDSGDLAGFYVEAQRARELQPAWFTIVLSDPATGQQFLNLLRPLGSSLPIFPDLVSHEHVVRSGKPLVVANPGQRGPLSGRPVFGIRVPVLRDGRVTHVLSAGLNPETLDQVLGRLDLLPRWIGTVVDTKGIVIACAGCARDSFGQPATAAVLEHIAGRKRGPFVAVNSNGVDSHIALGHAPTSGWTVGVSVPVADVAALWQRELWIIVLGGLICVATVLGAIAWLTRSRRALQQMLEMRVRERTAALRESEQRYAALANVAREGVAIHDDDRIVEANETFARMFGYAPEEVIAKSPRAFIAPQAPAEGGARPEAVDEPGESLGLRNDGTTFPIELCGASVEYHGRPMRVWHLRDLTAQKQAEAHLRELQAELLHVSRLNDMGQMAAALAHELTQPLTAAANYIGGCRRMLSVERFDVARLGVIREVMGLANDQTMHAGNIIRRLRDFMTRGETERQVENAAKVIEEASTLALTTARHRGVTVSVVLDTSAPILVDKDPAGPRQPHPQRGRGDGDERAQGARDPRDGIRRRGRNERERHRGRALGGDRRSPVSAVRLDQESGHGHRTVRLSRDHRDPPGTHLGGAQCPRRHHVPVHHADCGPRALCGVIGSRERIDATE
jgi:PAS domain S-box-containing protein